MTLQVRAPFAGRAVRLADVPDEVFAQGLVGPGTAINPKPAPDDALAPVSGLLAKLHPHAFVVVAEGGRGVLVHLGIDTVQLRGAGFELLAKEGEPVAAGQPVVRWDPAAVAASGRSPVCPVVALDASWSALSAVVEQGEVAAGDPLFVWERLR
jgi:PTS system N-acetylglucosamine-specific IIA component